MCRGKVKIIIDDEFNRLRSQIVTSNDNLNLKSQFATLKGRRRQRRKYLPYAFSEPGGCTIPMHTCKRVHKKAIELCIGAKGMHRYCACCTGGTQNNSLEFEGIKCQVGLNRFILSVKQLEDEERLNARIWKY